jgi:hypothetical protein
MTVVLVNALYTQFSRLSNRTRDRSIQRQITGTEGYTDESASLLRVWNRHKEKD